MTFAFTSVAYAYPAPVLDRSNYKYETLPAPVLLSPLGGTTSTSPVYSWGAVAGATRYEIDISTAAGVRIFRRDGIKDTYFVVPGEPRLVAGGEYSFTVRAYHHSTQQASPYAEPARFRVAGGTANKPPVAAFSASPTSGIAPLSVFFNAAASFDPDGQIVSYGWDFDSDGTIDATGSSASHVFETPGDYVTALTVSDDGGLAATVSRDIVARAARAPVAAFSASPTSGIAPLSVTFDAAASFDPDGQIVSYGWDFDSDGTIDATGSSASHVFETPGDYVTALTVSDDGGLAATVSRDIVARAARAPVAIFSASPTSGIAPLSVSFDAAASFGQDGQIVSYGWDFDSDGTIDATGSSVTHVFETPGDYVAALTVTDDNGLTTSVSQDIVARAARPPVAAFSASPTSGIAPLSVTFDAAASFGQDGRIVSYGWDFDSDGTVDATGSIADHTYSQPGTYTPTLVVVDDRGLDAATAQVVLVAVPVPQVGLSIVPPEILLGEHALLSWTSQDAASVVIEPGIGLVEPSGTLWVAPLLDTTYTVVATNASGEARASAFVAVKVVPPTASLSVSLPLIGRGESAVLSWTTSDADSVVIEPELGTVASSGSVTVTPSSSTTYTLTASSPSGQATAIVAVRVLPVPSPPQGSFADAYKDLVPSDATVASYDSRRFALITGRVLACDGSALSGVRVTVHGSPGYGSATTDEQGRYSLPVEGGANLGLDFEKDGLVDAHRDVSVAYRDVSVLDDVMLVALDTASTLVTFGGDASTTVVHTSSPLSDSRGTRSMTMVFSGDTTAWATDSSGNEVALSSATVRATQVPTEAAMPQALPPASAYTYCADLSIDGYQSVRFDKPVVCWVEDFLGFPVGEVVPVGFLDVTRAAWIAEKNGRVVKLLDTDGDGIVDALDATGDDLADDLDGDGALTDEVRGLTDPATWAPGSLFWRVEVSHFSPYDFNWPAGPPVSARPPGPCGGVGPPGPGGGFGCGVASGSVVMPRGRVVHEDVALPGTSMTLHYASDRASGYKQTITVPASAETVPESLSRIEVAVSVAGRTFTQTLPAAPNQVATFTWDGLDWLGRPARRGTTVAHISLTYVYPGVYYRSRSDLEKAFGVAGLGAMYGFVMATGGGGGGSGGGLAFVTIPIMREPRFTTKATLPLHLPYSQGGIAEGWTLSDNDAIDPEDPSVVYAGDGTRPLRELSVIRTLAGGETTAPTDPSAVRLETPRGVAVDAKGDMYIADPYFRRVYKRDHSTGVLSPYAGNGQPGYDESQDGGAALSARLDVGALACDKKGNLYVGGEGCRVRKIRPDGTIVTVAGNGLSPAWYFNSASLEGVPATQSAVYPRDIAVDDLGALYIADPSGCRLRKVGPDGLIYTLGGSGMTTNYGPSQDGTRATLATLAPYGVAVAGDGTVYLSDGYPRYRIRRIDPSGTLHTVGSLDARDMALDASGRIITLSPGAVWSMDVSGTATRIAGTGQIGYGGDGGPAVLASFDSPAAIALTPDGELIVADTNNHRIRRVEGMSRYAGAGVATVFAQGDGTGRRFGATGRHEATIDLATGRTLGSFGYDSAGRLSAMTDRFGAALRVTRTAEGTATAIVSPDGHTTRLARDAGGRLAQVILPDGTTRTFAYSPDGLMTEQRDGRSNLSTHHYDETGQVDDVADPEGGTWAFSRTVSAAGTMTSSYLTGEGNTTTYRDKGEADGSVASEIENPAGAKTTWRRSADRLSVAKRLPGGIALDFAYGIDAIDGYTYVKDATAAMPGGLSASVSQRRGRVDTDGDGTADGIGTTVTVNGRAWTSVDATAAGRLTRTSPSARRSVTLYDPATLLVSEVSAPGLLPQTMTYDSRGRVTAVTQGDRTAQLTYDASGAVASVTAPDGLTTTVSRDAMGRVTQVSRPDSSTISYAYDADGNVTALTNPADTAHTFTYDGNRQRATYGPPISGTYRYTYDHERNLRSVAMPSGRTITNGYMHSFLTSVTTPEGTTDLVRGKCGRLNAAIRTSEVASYTYDGWLITRDTRRGTVNTAIAYGYDSDLRTTTVSYADATETLSYDPDGLVVSSGPFTIARDADSGLPATVTAPGMAVSRTFSGYGELDASRYSSGGSPTLSWSVTRDRAGRIATKTEVGPSGTTTYGYTYDPVGRLVRVTKDGVLAEAYSYDANGNRTSETVTARGVARTSTYDSEDRLLASGPDTYSFDADGFLSMRQSTDGTSTYTYSARGELLAVALPSGRTLTYTYDGLGRRIAKAVDGTLTETYLWGDATTLLAVMAPDGTVRQRFVYADDRVPFSVQTTSGTYFLSFDQVGSLRTVTDSSGAVERELTYDSFGNVVSDTHPAFSLPFGFAGGFADPDTGLVHFGARDYDPATGRWTAKDPIDFAGGDANLYGYCVGDPVGLVDPSGLWDLRFCLTRPDAGGWNRLAIGMVFETIPVLRTVYGAADMAEKTGSYVILEKGTLGDFGSTIGFGLIPGGPIAEFAYHAILLTIETGTGQRLAIYCDNRDASPCP